RSLDGREDGPHRPVPVRDAPDPERHTRPPDPPLTAPPLDLRRDLLQPLALLFQLALPAPLGLFRGLLLPRLDLGALLGAERRELRLGLLLHLVEGPHRPRRH